MVSNRKKHILIALYHDYHLFGYFHHLIPSLLKHDYDVTLLTCDRKIIEKYNNFSSHPDFHLKYSRWVSRMIQLMENPILRPFIWCVGWPWSYFNARKYDAVIVPRDSKPFQHMISAWIPALVVQPGLSNDDKRYLRHIYTGKIPFPIPEVRNNFQTTDSIFGGSYLLPVRGKNAMKFYSVIGEDFKSYFQALHIPAERIGVTGNPNYEGLLNMTEEAENLPYLLPQDLDKDLYIYFSSQLEFTNYELDRLAEIFEYLANQLPKPVFALKIHPRMKPANISELKLWASQIKSLDVRIIDGMKGDENNMKLITLSKAIFIEDSNVGVLAAWAHKPLLVMNLSDKEDDNIYKLYDGILDITDLKNIPHALEVINSPEKCKIVLAGQIEMIKRISARLESPNQKIVDLIGGMLH